MTFLLLENDAIVFQFLFTYYGVDSSFRCRACFNWGQLWAFRVMGHASFKPLGQFSERGALLQNGGGSKSRQEASDDEFPVDKKEELADRVEEAREVLLEFRNEEQE